MTTPCPHLNLSMDANVVWHCADCPQTWDDWRKIPQASQDWHLGRYRRENPARPIQYASLGHRFPSAPDGPSCADADRANDLDEEREYLRERAEGRS